MTELMKELRCDCSDYSNAQGEITQPLLLKYDDDVIEVRCRKCKKNHVLAVIDGNLQVVVLKTDEQNQQIKTKKKWKQQNNVSHDDLRQNCYENPHDDPEFKIIDKMMRNSKDIIY